MNGGKPSYDDIIDYQFGHVEEYEIPSSPSEDLPPSPITITDSLPDYIPSYFPPFPEIKEDNAIDEADKSLLEKQQQLEEQKQQQLQIKAQGESLPLPIIVKKRKKPIENPFTHIIPFEESTLASENEDAQQAQQQQQQQKLLSLLLKIENNKKRNEKEDEELELERRKAAATPLLNALQSVKPPTYNVGEGLKDKDRLFIQDSQDVAAPGNHLFNQDAGIFDKLVRHISDPLVISKLTAPNLLIDVATITSTTSNNSPSTTPHHLLYDYSSPGSSRPTSPEGPSKVSRSSSMLAVLAGGTSQKKAGLKKLNKLSKLAGPNQSSPMSLSAFAKEGISKSSIDINSFKGGDSKYIIKKKRMLAEQEQAAKRQKMLEEAKNNPNADIGLLNGTGINTTTAAPMMSNGTHNTATPTTTMPASTSTPAISSMTTTAPSTSFTSSMPKPPPENANNSSNSAPTKISLQNNVQKPKGPISLQSFSSSAMSATNSSVPPLTEKKKKSKKTPNLVLNLSQNPVPTFTPTEENTLSPSTPKIRFKVKGPEQPLATEQPMSLSSKLSKNPSFKPSTPTEPIKPQQQTNYQLHLYQQPQTAPRLKLQANNSNNNSDFGNSFTTSEEIRCICENPTVDYGTFMIACDNCSVWFHGSCVGIKESDQVEEWYCRRCKRKLFERRQ